MKKSLLFAAALVCAASVNAQVFQMNGEDFQIGSEATPIAEGLIWGPTTPEDPFTFSNPYATDHKSVDCKNNNYNQVVFNGTDIVVTKGGVQGQDNPKDIDGGNPGITLNQPASGAAVKMLARQNGYVYVVAKLSSNKNYYVFEEGTAVGFTLAMQVENANFPGNIIKYTVEGEGELNEVTDPAKTDWPEKVVLGEGWEAAAGDAGKIGVNGLGVICFPVYEDCYYLIGAGGSKISWCGAYFSETLVSVVLQGTDAENPVEDFVLIAGGDEPEPVDPVDPEQPEEPTVKVLWTNETGEAIPAWGGTFRFCNEEHKTGEEIYAFSMEDWALIKEGVVRVGLDLTDASNIRICDGWWSTTYAGADHNCIDLVQTAEDGSKYIDINIKEDGNMYDTIDEKHLLFTGDAYTITSISVVSGANALNKVQANTVAGVAYNVNGQKVNGAKGLQIVNGKVIMVK